MATARRRLRRVVAEALPPREQAHALQLPVVRGGDPAADDARLARLTSPRTQAGDHCSRVRGEPACAWRRD